MIEIYLLEHLAAFSECRTLTEAAEKLHLTQSTLTRSMQKLEDAFGVPLFMRTKNRLALNQNGVVAAEEAKNVLLLERRMIERVMACANGLQNIRIGTCLPGAAKELAKLIPAFFPQAEVEICYGDKDSVIGSLKKGEVRIGITYEQPPADAFYSLPCGECRVFADFMPGHRLAGADHISFADANGESFILPREGSFWHEVLQKNMPDSLFIAQQGSEALNTVITNSTLPVISTNLSKLVFGRSPGRVSVPFSDPEARTEWHCACRAEDRDLFARLFDELRGAVGRKLKSGAEWQLQDLFAPHSL